MSILRVCRLAAVPGVAALFVLGVPGALADDDGLDFGNEIEIEPVTGAVEIEGDEFRLKATNERFRFDGPGYRSSLSGGDLRVDIDAGLLGLREDNDSVNPVTVDIIDLAKLAGFTFNCGPNSYNFVDGELVFTRRVTSDGQRPPPYSPGFNANFPIATLIGEINGTVANQSGELFEVFGIDSADEILTDEGHTAATGVQLNFVGSDGVVVDRVAFSGNFNGNGETSETVIVDHGTCRTLAGPGVVVSGPFFVFPFVADRLITIRGF